MSSQPPPLLYKGLALFTPGGDLVYCIDPNKQGRWHLQLCMALQDLLQLPDPPLFLIPCYTATIDRWHSPHSQQLQVSAEAYPRVWQHRWLLNQIFDTAAQPWQRIVASEETCDPLVINSYRQQFPQLWEHHNWVVQLNHSDGNSQMMEELQISARSETGATAFDPMAGEQAEGGQAVAVPMVRTSKQQGYMLRLFVAGSKSNTANILTNLHQLLDHALNCPYTLNVIDVIKRPDLAEADQVAATPTLLKVWPPPTRKLIGAVDQPDHVMKLLNSPSALES